MFAWRQSLRVGASLPDWRCGWCFHRKNYTDSTWWHRTKAYHSKFQPGRYYSIRWLRRLPPPRLPVIFYDHFRWGGVHGCRVVQSWYFSWKDWLGVLSVSLFVDAMTKIPFRLPCRGFTRKVHVLLTEEAIVLSFPIELIRPGSKDSGHSRHLGRWHLQEVPAPSQLRARGWYQAVGIRFHRLVLQFQLKFTVYRRHIWTLNTAPPWKHRLTKNNNTWPL